MNKKTITFTDCFKKFTVDQDKAIKPEDTIERFYEKLKNLDFEILKEVRRIDNGRLDIPVYFSVCAENTSQLTGTKKQMGKGASPVQAKASACMELGERFSFFSFKSNPDNFITGDYLSMRDAGYPVMEMSYLLQSVHDTENNEAFLEKLLENIPMQWTWATNITRGEDVLIPFSWFFAINEFNGPSAGNTYEEAAIQGICEIVERHVCSVVNHQELKTPAIHPDSVNDPVARDLIDKFKKHNIDLYLNDFSLDTGICTVGALAIDRSTFPDLSEIVYTAGTTPGAEKAVIRAITEVAQLAGDFNTGSNYVASGLPKPLSMDEVKYLTDPGLETTIEGMNDLSSDNIKVEVENCVEALKNINFEVFMIDVTHPQLDIPALYTIVPGAHFRERSMICDVGLFAAKLLVELVDDPEFLEEKLAGLETLLPEAYYLEFYRGRNLYNKGEPEKAISCFDRALAKNPEEEDIPYIYSYKSLCLKELERFDDAIETVRAGCEIDGERPDFYNTLGVCYFKKKEYQKAIDSFKRAVHLNPASAMDYANIGVNYKQLGDNDEAIRYYTLALTLDPSISFAQEHLKSLMAEQQ